MKKLLFLTRLICAMVLISTPSFAQKVNQPDLKDLKKEAKIFPNSAGQLENQGFTTSTNTVNLSNDKSSGCFATMESADKSPQNVIYTVRDEIQQKLKSNAKVTLDLFVMSKCPFGVMAEETLLPLVKEFGHQVDFRLNFIASEELVGDQKVFSSMHGQEEIDENIRQLVVARDYPEKLVAYLTARAKNYTDNNWQLAASEAGIDIQTLDLASKSAESQALFRSNINLAQTAGINASPTLLINGEQYRNQIITTALPTACQIGTDPFTGSGYVVCSAGPTGAWISANNSGIYHATYICQSLGYNAVGSYGGTCGSVCGYCTGGTSCSSPQVTTTFDGSGNGGTDAYGLILRYTVQWQCVGVLCTPPTINCPTNINMGNTSGQCGANVTYPVATTTGTSPTVTYSIPSGSFFPLGTTTVTATATNNCGTQSCTFTVTVNDTQTPTIACPANITVNNTPGQCGAKVCYTTPVITENCRPAAPTGYTYKASYGNSYYYQSTALMNYATAQSSAIAAGGHLAVITSAAENNALNASGAGFGWIGGNDLIANGVWEYITCESSSYTNWCGGEPNGGNFENHLEFETGGCWNDLVNTAFRYSIIEIEGAKLTQTNGLAQNAFFPVGTTTNTFVATDASGNTSTCSFTVTVNDTQPPVITCPTNIVVNNTPGQCGANVTFAATATDNCGTANLSYSPVSGSFFSKGTSTVTVTANDGHGNTASCTFTVTVNDTEAPSITCAPTVVVSNTPGLCSGTATLTAPVITDNCSVAPQMSVNGSFDSGSDNWNQCGNNVEAYGTEAGYGGTNPFNAVAEIDHEPVSLCQSISGFVVGQTYQLTFRASRRSGAPPTVGTVITLDGGALNTTVSRSNNIFNLTPETLTFVATQTTHQLTFLPSPGWGGTVGFIIDDISINRQFISNNAPPTFPFGNTTVTWTATDASGNTASCNQTVTVNDTEAPTITCPANINVDMDPGSCGAVVTFAASASDNCGTATISYSPASGSLFAVGTTTVTATADDGHGNTASCTFTVTVDLLDHVNLQWPPNATICPGGSFTAYGQVYEPNVTTVIGQQGANIEVQFGYSSTNTNPSGWSNWFPTLFNQYGGGPNNDEYYYDFSSNVPGTYYYTFRYRQNGCTWQYGGFQQWDGGTWDGTNYVSGVLTVQSLDWANLQWPPNATICQGSSMTAYGQVYEAGVTPGGGSQGAGIDVQFGYSTTNTNPSGWSNWSTASFNQFGGGFANDEYYYNFTPPSSGTYYYTFRYRLNGCLWQYGGFTNGGGYFWDGTNSVSGSVNVNPTTVGGAVSGGTSICPGETSALLTLSGHTGTILRWESSIFPFLSWDPIANNTTNYTSGPLAETTQFRAVIQSGVCLQENSATTTVIVYLTYPFFADNDDDDYGAGPSILLCSDDANNAPEGYSVDGTDCDDTLADRHETFPFFVDGDGDGYGAEGSTAIQLCAVDGDTPPESNYSVNDDDCNDGVFDINPGVAEIPFDNIDNNCNGTLYDGHPLIVVHVLSPSCGGINHGLNNTINCTEIYLGEGFVIGYRFKVTNLSTGQVDYVDTVQHHFKLTDTDIYAYGTSYSIQVAAIVNGEVQGYNGSVCTLTTTNVATTKVVNSQCGSTLLFMNSTINANAVNSAITYRFRVARADAPGIYYYTGERNLPNFNLTMLTVPVGFLTYATEYKVAVQIKIKLANITAWSQFGQVCSIFTPQPPTSSIISSQCELVASSYTQVINATPFAGATLYRFLLTHYDEFGVLDYQQYQDSATPSFTLSMFTGLQPNTVYSVAVSMQLYGTFVPYDKDCSITTPPSAKAEIELPFNATAYPNPYTENFLINVKTTNIEAIAIKVYDMVGRLVEQRVVKVNDLENTTIGERYPSGVYNIVVSQGEEVKTLRVVKR
ncbi:HYR domain-containing protein [Flavobacterium buctense]|uniref:HYR domain-containing protein n=1 Tax=Flavobacterium buctense TaxID=1648146 RepID=A0ABU9E594_9FLAO|nr:HYR domain-containing protein [Flavobacterium buctense]